MECETIHQWISEPDDFITVLSNCTVMDPSGTSKVRTSEDCPCEIGILGFWESPERHVVDFLPAYGYDSVFVVTRPDNIKSKGTDNLVFKAFSSTVWWCVFALFVMFAIIMFSDPYFAPLPQKMQPTTALVTLPDDLEQHMPDNHQSNRRFMDEPVQSIRTAVQSFQKRIIKLPQLYRVRRAIQSTGRKATQNYLISLK